MNNAITLPKKHAINKTHCQQLIIKKKERHLKKVTIMEVTEAVKVETLVADLPNFIYSLIFNKHDNNFYGCNYYGESIIKITPGIFS